MQQAALLRRTKARITDLTSTIEELTADHYCLEDRSGDNVGTGQRDGSGSMDDSRVGYFYGDHEADVAVTGTGGDVYWLVGEPLEAWLKEVVGRSQ